MPCMKRLHAFGNLCGSIRYPVTVCMSFLVYKLVFVDVFVLFHVP